MPIKDHYLTRNLEYRTKIAHIQKWGASRLTQSKRGELSVLQVSLQKDAVLRKSNSEPTQTYLDSLTYLELAKINPSLILKPQYLQTNFSNNTIIEMIARYVANTYFVNILIFISLPELTPNVVPKYY